MTSVTQFAQDCYEKNTIKDIQWKLSMGVNLQECAEWGLTEDDWRRALLIAKKQLTYDTQQSGKRKTCRH